MPGETPQKSAAAIEAIRAAAEKAEIPKEKLDRALTAVRNTINAISETLQKLKPDARNEAIRKIANAVGRLANSLASNGAHFENLAQKTKTEIFAITGVAFTMQQRGGNEAIKDLLKMSDGLRNGEKDIDDIGRNVAGIHAEQYYFGAIAEGQTAVDPRWKQVSAKKK